MFTLFFFLFSVMKITALIRIMLNIATAYSKYRFGVPFEERPEGQCLEERRTPFGALWVTEPLIRFLGLLREPYFRFHYSQISEYAKGRSVPHRIGY